MVKRWPSQRPVSIFGSKFCWNFFVLWCHSLIILCRQWSLETKPRGGLLSPKYKYKWTVLNINGQSHLQKVNSRTKTKLELLSDQNNLSSWLILQSDWLSQTCYSWPICKLAGVAINSLFSIHIGQDYLHSASRVSKYLKGWSVTVHTHSWEDLA